MLGRHHSRAIQVCITGDTGTELHRHGADVFTKDDQGRGLLHVLAKRKAEPGGLNALGDLFQYFVDKGMDPWLEDHGHMTPLDVAAVWENEAILEKFRKEKREEKEMDMGTGTETLDE